VAHGIAVSASGIVYMVGSTLSTDLTMVNAAQPGIAAGFANDAFVAVIAENDSNTDLSVSQTDFPDPVPMGGTVTYTIQVTNSGPSDATNTVVATRLLPEATLVSTSASQGSCSSDLPVTCSLGTIAVGETATMSIVVQPFVTATLSNKVTVASRELDPDPSDNTVIEDTTVSGPAANLAVTVTGSPDLVKAPGNVLYRIVVVNNGPSIAQNVILRDSTAGADIFDLVSVNSTVGTCYYPYCYGFGCFFIDLEPQRINCELGDMSPGLSATVNMTVRLDFPTGTRTNTAIVTSDASDSNSSNNTSEETTTVTSSSGDGGGGGGGGGG